MGTTQVLQVFPELWTTQVLQVLPELWTTQVLPELWTTQVLQVLPELWTTQVLQVLPELAMLPWTTQVLLELALTPTVNRATSWHIATKKQTKQIEKLAKKIVVKIAKTWDHPSSMHRKKIPSKV